MKFLARVLRSMPVYTMPASSSMNGALKIADNGMLTTATVKMTKSKLEALEKVAEPSRHMPVQSIKAAVCKL